MSNQILVKMVLDAWYSKLKSGDVLFDQLSDEQLQNEVAPNRNRGIYLLGHLTGVHDMMLPLLNLGEQLYPQLKEGFIDQPDKSATEIVTASELRQYWKNVNAALENHFNKFGPDDWFQKHNSVSVEDFNQEPHRNKLNVLISRTNHLSYHLGQMVFLKK